MLDGSNQRLNLEGRVQGAHAVLKTVPSARMRVRFFYPPPLCVLGEAGAHVRLKSERTLFDPERTHHLT